ncbi:hypothetical protein [Tissierella creatinophila]|uniref:Uncharacterized protein n=1 Tax=Tissierella creatinophila DSM 6911 TaxID=1123403 RepID=A0A1U7M3I8_TISCR|nr:hypothetical protein [Tissierella creatinophila]OLS01884.1 hypothetical protein TICRE_21540 [Tissierella creatinophila DSM 6911]
MKNRILSLLLIIILIFTNSISLANDYNSKQNLNVNETTIIGESIITVLEDNSNKYVVEEIEGGPLSRKRTN